jgi:type VI secretion system protein ImpJ
MFLRPQHFQQHDRHIENWVNGRCAGLRGFDWGFVALKLDQGELANGRLAIAECRGVFNDGTPFNLPDGDDVPLALEIDSADFKGGVVYLSLPLRRPGFAEIAGPAQAGSLSLADSLARYSISEIKEVPDAVSGAIGGYPVQVGRLRTRLTLARQEGHACLGVARVKEIRADKTVVLDEQFIPPVLFCSAAANLQSYLRELQGMLQTRADALAGLTVEATRLGPSGVAHFLLLQTLNRYEPLLAHLASAARLHPEEFYRLGLQLAGELSTFYKTGKRPVSFPAYDHDNLQAGFGPLMAELRRLLAEVIDPNAVRITLVYSTKYNMHITPNRAEYADLLDKAAFVLGVKASVPTETLRTGFPRQVKIGPGEDIRQVVNLNLPGIEISPLMQLPQALPSRPDFCYFGLGKQGELWQKMSKSGGFALHVSDSFPNLEFEFWAIKG